MFFLMCGRKAKPEITRVCVIVCGTKGNAYNNLSLRISQRALSAAVRGIKGNAYNNPSSRISQRALSAAADGHCNLMESVV